MTDEKIILKANSRILANRYNTFDTRFAVLADHFAGLPEIGSTQEERFKVTREFSQNIGVRFELMHSGLTSWT